MKIIIFPGYYLPHIGGVETHTDEFAKYLSKKGSSIYIFAPNLPQDKEFEIRHNQVKVIRYPAFELISNYPLPKFWRLKFWKLIWQVFQQNFDLAITRTRFFSNSLLGFILAKTKRIKLVHVEHGSAFVRVESKLINGFAYAYDLTVGKLIFNRADYVIAISNAVKEFVKNFTPREVPVIYRGIEIEQIQGIEPDQEIQDKFQRKIKICFVGRLYKWKGIENLIKAYQELPENTKQNVVVLIVGYGEDIERLKRLANKDLNEGIYFLGKQPFHKAISTIKASDLYVHPSYPGGGLATTLLEAMCCQKPIVASPHEGAKEVINVERGILLKDNSPESLKYGILHLLKNKNKWKELGANSYQFIQDNFNWEKNIKKYIQLFQDILPEGL